MREHTHRTARNEPNDSGSRGVTALVVALVAMGLLAPAGVAGAAQATTAADAGAALANDSAVESLASGGSVSIQSVETVPAQPYAGQSIRFKVTLKNDGDVPTKIRKVEILPKTQEEFVPVREYATVRNLQVLQPGETKTVTFEQQQGDRKIRTSGIKRLRANVTVRTKAPSMSRNETVHDSKLFSIRMKEPPQRPMLSIRSRNLVATESGTVVVEVINPAEIPLKNVELGLTGSVGVKNGNRVLSSIPAEGSRTFEFNVSADSAGDRTVETRLRYTILDGKKRRASKQRTITFEEPKKEDDPAPAQLVLSGASAELKDGKVHLTGELGNEGGVQASGVTIEVVDTEHVDPSQPYPTYFVEGGIAPDDTKAFDLYADVDPNASTVKVEITYQSGDEEKTMVKEISPPEALGQSSADEETGGGGIDPLLGGLLVLAVLGMIGYAWRNADDDGDDAPVSPDSGDDAPVSADETAAPPAPQSRGPGQQAPRRGGQPQGRAPRNPQQGAPQGRAPGQRQPQQPNQHQPQGEQHAPQGNQGAPPQENPQSGTQSPSQGQQSSSQPDGSQARDGQGPQGPEPGGAGAAGAGAGGKEIRCDGCGQPYPPSQMGTVALTEGQSARTCQDCQIQALEAAKNELGADRSASGVDELVSAMSGHPTCDGCGEAMPETELQEMTLPDGSSALSCSECRKEALEAAREEIVGE